MVAVPVISPNGEYYPTEEIADNEQSDKMSIASSFDLQTIK